MLPASPLLSHRLYLRLDLILRDGWQLQGIQPGQPLGQPLRPCCAFLALAQELDESATSATRLGGSFFSSSIN